MVFRKTHPEFHKINLDFIKSKIIFEISGCDFQNRNSFTQKSRAILKNEN